MANTVAYGFIGQEDLFSQRVTDSNIAVVREAITLSIAEHNRQVNAAMAAFVQRTTQYQVRFRLPGGGTLQPLDEWGNPLPVRQGESYDIGFPIQGGGTAWGDNRVTRALMTVEEVNDNTLHAIYRDANWMKRHVLAAVLDNTSWTYPDKQQGNLTVQPLANGDTSKYVFNNGLVATDDHYFAQTATVADATNPFPTIYSELTEHPANAGAEIVAYIPSNLVSAVEGLANFYPVRDGAIQEGANTAVLVGSIDRGFGDEVLGRTDKVWIIEWGMLPDNYILGMARGARSSVLWQREYDAGELQGLFTENHSPDGNLNEYRFIRYAGFGSYNRVGAVVYQVSGGDTTYDIPSGYATPLAV